MATVDLMIHRDHIDMTHEGLAAITTKLQDMGFKDYHEGILFRLGQLLGLPYLCVEVVNDEGTRDICWASHANDEDIVVKSLDELYAKAAEYVDKEAC